MRYGNDDQRDQGDVEAGRLRSQTYVQLCLLGRRELVREYEKVTRAAGLYPGGGQISRPDMIATIIRLESES